MTYTNQNLLFISIFIRDHLDMETVMHRFSSISLVVLMILVFCQGIYVPDYKDHRCIRECKDNDVMTCEYDFTLEYYFTLTKACYNCPFNTTDCQRPHCIAADGVPRGLVVANRMLPGPAVHVCKNDLVKVNIHNRLDSAEGVTIHWHGLHQKGYQHMDGVPMVTQCPIPVETSFQYSFPAVNLGTYFWHSHTGVQRADGLFGAFVVREADDYHLYDYDLPEHTVVVFDWMVELAINRFANHHHAGGDNKPASMLINGKGKFQEFVAPGTGEKVYTPYEVFNISSGRRYRFRVISNGILNCPIQFSIDNHTLGVFESDGNPFKKTVVESFNIFAGERFDFVLNADQPIGNYWMRVRGMADCGVKKAHQQAILRYNGAPETEPTAPVGFEHGFRDGKKLNPWNKKGTDELIQMSDLEATIPNDNDDKIFKETPDKKFYLAMDFYDIDNFKFQDPTYYPIHAIDRYRLYSPQINRISTIMPSVPLLTQFKDFPNNAFCNADTLVKNCSEEYCECVHHLKVGLGDVVEMILIDEGQRYNANHPFHLHGYSFRVIGMDRLNISTSREEVMELDRQGQLPRNLNKSAVAKDSITVPDGGYVIIRFHANNPGFWLLHCHISFHNQIGMGLIVQVGEINQMPKVPRHFPRCGMWKFSGYDDGNDGNSGKTQCTSGSESVTTRHILLVLALLGSFVGQFLL